jgi:hypothetical protein
VSVREGLRSSTPDTEAARAKPHAPPPATAVELARLLQDSVGNAAAARVLARDTPTVTAPAPAPAPPAPTKAGETGIGARPAVARFVAVAKSIEKEWTTLATADKRAQKLGDAANEELKKAGVEPCTVKVEAMDSAGALGFRTWTLRIGSNAFAKATVSLAELADAADTIYHEARHAEQWFRMARLRAGAGKKADEIEKELKIPPTVAKAAEGKPLTGTGIEVTEATAWYESVYGSASTHRDTVLTELPKASAALTKAVTDKAAVDKDPASTAAAKKAAADKVEAARTKRADLYKQYRELPEEADGWVVGGAVTTGVFLYDRK